MREHTLETLTKSLFYYGRSSLLSLTVKLAEMENPPYFFIASYDAIGWTTRGSRALNVRETEYDLTNRPGKGKTAGPGPRTKSFMTVLNKETEYKQLVELYSMKEISARMTLEAQVKAQGFA
jgi:hypothetical protein